MSTATAERAVKPAQSIQRKSHQPTFFRKAAGDTFFGKSAANSFFSPSLIQPKLTVSQPGDPYEKEADDAADKVMRMSESASASLQLKDNEELQAKKDEENQEDKVQAKMEALPVASIQCKENDEEKEEVEKSDLMVNPKGELVQCMGEEPDMEDKVQTKTIGTLLYRKESEVTGSLPDEGDTEVQTKIFRKNISLFRSDIVQRSGRGPPANSPSIEDQLSSTKGRGYPLSGDTKTFMENRFQSDFSNVRIHTGSEAQHLSRAMHAHAFTHGGDIYFNSGKYNTNSAEGKTLLAHELTHTIHQGASISKKTVISENLPQANHISKKEADNPADNGIIQLKAYSDSILSGIDLSGKSGGGALSTEAKEYLQDYYKTNLNDIRIHTDNETVVVCKSLGIHAFTQGRNIFILPSKYNPDSEQGAILLSEQVSKSLKQRGIKSTGPDGNDISGVSGLVNQITAAVKENKAEENELISKNKPTAESVNLITEKPKKETGKKEIKGGKEKKKGKKEKKKLKAVDTGGPFIKAVKRDPKKSPSIPGEDPAFLRVINNTKTTAKNQKQHEPAELKSSDAQKHAEAVPKEAESKAQNRKTDGMGEAAKKDKPFDAASFKADLLKKIESITPKTLEEATEFKENNKIAGVKNAMGEKVASEKENTTGPVDKATEQPLQVNDADNKKSVPLPPTNKGAKPSGVGAQNAVPKSKLNNEISMQEQSQSLDDEMKANNVTEDQLASSNEPSFNEALNEKRNAQKDAVEKPQQYRQEEKLALKDAKTNAQDESVKSLAGMYSARGKNFEITVKHQQTAKQKDEERRATIAKDIESKYLAAEEKVNKALDDADTQSNKIFDEGSEAARLEFENYVDEKMRAYKRRRYSGFWGGLRWAKDKLFGMPDDVNEFYKEGRQLYLNKMDAVITQVADFVTLKLNEAKQAIADGKKEIDEYVSKLPKDLQDIGKEAAANIQDKFDALEQSVDDKRNDLIDNLAKKYVDNVKKLDDRINELKEANKGLIDKAIGFLKKVWQVIKDLVNLFTTILARLASIIGIILDSPSGFFDNLGKAFNRGFNNFKDKFLDYLESGLMIWLATNLGIAGIELPEKFSAAAIFSLVLQVMGITKEHIRERAVKILGERKVKLLETAGGVLYRIYNEGLGVLWDLIKEKLTDFKEIVWEAIKSFIKKKIIEAALMFLLSLLNPIGAFIKVCMAIYDFLMMLVRFKDRIIELLDTILNAVTDIAAGAVDAAANAIEKAFAKSIPIIIAFLAALLHLNDIAARVRDIITRIRTRVDKAIDWVLKKALIVGGKLLQVGKSAIAAIKRWLGLEKTFTADDGKNHKLYFTGNEENPLLMLNSNPTAYSTFIASVDVGTDKKKKTAKNEALYIAGKIDTKRKEKLAGTTEEEKEKSKEAKLVEVQKLLDDLSKPTAVLFGDPSLAGEPELVNTVQSAGHAASMRVKKLNKKQTLTGSPPTASNTASYAVLNTRRQSSSASYYVKGHMLNDNIGGKGVWDNLTPLSREGNSNHEGAVESLVKAAFNSGAVVEYNVTAVYGYGNNASSIPADDPQREPKLKIISEEKNVPTKLECEAWILEKKGDIFDRKQSLVSKTVDNPVGQDAASYILEGEPGRADIYLNTSDVSVIATIENFSASLAVKVQQAHSETGKSRFSSYTDLSNAKKKDDNATIFTEDEKAKILALNTLKYVKLYKGTV